MLDALVQSFGRSHMVILHFPIALLLVGLGIEGWRLVRPRKVLEIDGESRATCIRKARYTPSPSAFSCVAFAAIIGSVTALSGWLYADAESLRGGSLEWHRWLGIVGAGLAVLTLLLGLIAALARVRVMVQFYRLSLVFGAIAVAWAGHLGGELVHGKGFLFEPVVQHFSEPEPTEATIEPDPASDLEQPAPPDEAGESLPGADPADPPVRQISFELDIEPIFADNCVKCHRDGKSRGDFRLDTPELALDAITPGNPDASELVRLISLPESDRDSMPKKKPNLAPEQIETITAWIRAMPVSDAGLSVGENAQTHPEPIRAPGPVIETPNAALAFEAADRPFELTPEQARARDVAIERLRGLLISAGIRAQGIDGVEVRVFENRAFFTDDQLDALDGLEPCLTMLDLTGTSISDAGLEEIGARFPRLRVLRIGSTFITDSGLASLAALTELALIDLHMTGVSAQGIEAVSDGPAMRLIRCWGTGVTQDELEDLSARFPGVEFDAGD